MNAKEKAVIFDIDGTLATLNGRDPYNTSLCEQDECCSILADIAVGLYPHYRIILLTGRYESYRQQTEQWLYDHYVPYHDLFLRPNEDVRRDTVYKRDVYERLISPKYDVRLVFEDRPRVLRMWRELGLRTADVGPGVEF